jgi:hypothetical protein
LTPPHPTEIRIGFPVPLEPPQDGASKDQELRLIRRPAQPLGKHVHRLVGFFQTVQKSGEMQSAFDVGGLQFEQLAVGSDCLAGERSGGQLIGSLESLFRETQVPGRSGRAVVNAGGRSMHGVWVTGRGKGDRAA